MAVTIGDLQREMESLLATLEQTNDQAHAFELEENLATLKIKKRAGILDPFIDIDTLTALDLKQLSTCVAAAKGAIADIQKRNDAVAKAMVFVRGAIKAAGLAI